MGQSMTKIPFKDNFWKGTTRTRPSESNTDVYFISENKVFSSAQLNFVLIFQETVL